MTETDRNYDLQARTLETIAAPRLPYEPPEPRSYRPRIGLIGCGGITETHLSAYRDAGYDVVALASRSEERANARRESFYPSADVYTDYRQLLARQDIDVVDVATDPGPRAKIMEDALNAGKHVLSQKPFVIDLETGRRLADLADSRGLKIAVNQNGRWAPHFSYLREAVSRDLIGRVATVDISIHWDHNWTANTPFDEIPHLILFDFAVHWFDFVASVMAGREPQRVTASVRRSPSQRTKPSLLAQAAVEYEDALVTLLFDADAPLGSSDRTAVRGSKGKLESVGPPLSDQQVTGYTAEGRFEPELSGEWFKEGFRGCMSELLCAIEDDREPLNGARDNLRSLQLCYAAVESADTGRSVDPNPVTALRRGAAGPHG